MDVQLSTTSDEQHATSRRRGFILTAMCTSLLVVMLANSALNLALPSLTADLGVTTLQQTWIVDLYALAFAALLFLSGAVGDRYGRRILLQIGLGIFAVACAWAAFAADDGASLIAARGMMGVGAALVMPTTLSIINVVFPAGERARAIAIWTGVAGAGTALGSVLSGFLLENFDWRSVFVLQLILAVVAFAANQVLAPESRDEQRTPVDWLGGVLSTTGVLGLVYVIIEAPSNTWSDPDIIAASVAAVVCLGAFVAWQTRTAYPMLDITLFRNPVFTGSALACLVAFFALMGAFFALAQLMQLVMGYGPLKSALLTLPIMAPMMVLAPLVPRLSATLGARWTITAGLTLMAAGFGWATTWSGDADVTYPGVLLPMLVVIAGMAVAMTPATNLLMAAVPRNRSGMGSAMNDTVRELGGALGVAVLGSLIAGNYRDGLPGSLAEAAGSNLAVAVRIFTTPQTAPALDAARQAWMTGLAQAMGLSAAVALVLAVIIAVIIPSRSGKGPT